MAQNALWREDFGKKHVYILVTKIYYWNIQRTWNGHQKVDMKIIVDKRLFYWPYFTVGINFGGGFVFAK